MQIFAGPKRDAAGALRKGARSRKGQSSPERASLTELFLFSNAQVTTIAEALALHKSLESKGTGSWDKEVDEEYEDADGNVYNKKTYDDLKRQGLI